MATCWPSGVNRLSCVEESNMCGLWRSGTFGRASGLRQSESIFYASVDCIYPYSSVNFSPLHVEVPGETCRSMPSMVRSGLLASWRGQLRSEEKWDALDSAISAWVALVAWSQPILYFVHPPAIANLPLLPTTSTSSFHLSF